MPSRTARKDRKRDPELGEAEANEQELDRGPGQQRSPPMHPHSGFCGQAAGREERARSLDRGEELPWISVVPPLHHRVKNPTLAWLWVGVSQ